MTMAIKNIKSMKKTKKSKELFYRYYKWIILFSNKRAKYSVNHWRYNS